MTQHFRVIQSDVLAGLATLADGSARCCVTSPPYWGLRDYGTEGQLGLESTPEAYVAKMVEVFREVRRVLADDGTLWLNLGDSYARAPEKGGSGPGGKNLEYSETYGLAQSAKVGSSDGAVGRGDRPGTRAGSNELKPKDLVGIPWRVAFALQADGWYLRSDIIWHKPNPMPESVTDRPTKSHEYLFLLAKSARYYYDAAAVSEPNSEDMIRRSAAGHTRGSRGKLDRSRCDAETLRGEHAKEITATGRNRRSVWTVATQPFREAHFAVMPEALVEPCILAGSSAGDMILDPFAGSGTVGVVALRHGRNFVGTELNPEYAVMARKRIQSDQPLLNEEIA